MLPDAGPTIDAATKRAAATRVGIVVAAVAIGLVLNHVLQRHLATLQTLAQTDPIAARAQLALEMRIGGLALFAVTAALGLSIVLASRRTLQILEFPPPGIWSWGAARRVSGPAARPLGWVGIALGAALVVCSVAGGALSWEMGTRLLACRAGLSSADTPSAGRPDAPGSRPLSI